MKYIIIALVILFTTQVSFAQEYVRGYYRSNGTYVQPYYRSNADSTVQNNYSYRGNTNPYTGQQGTNYYRNDSSSQYYNNSYNNNYQRRY